MARELIPGFRQVNPVEARMGKYLDMFPCSKGGFQGLKRALVEAESARVRHGYEGEVVYTKMNNWGGKRKYDVWQIYLIRK